jgi:signal transduction histidine kinase/CheY-like chemotaxis protein
VADVIRLRRKDTGESWFGSYNFAPIQDHGTTVGAVFTARDITGQLRAKEALRQEVAARETAQSVAAHAERMQALGQLAGGIAHDFNNVLQAIEGATALIERRPKDEAAVRRLARLANQAVGRGGSITRRLLAFGRRGDLRAEALDAVDLLGGIREILTHTLGAHIEVHVRLGADLPPLLADKGQLETVLVNLGTNARDAMPKGGRLTIAAESEIISLDGSAHLVGTAPRRYVRFTVTDTGTGMDAATLARAAEPFFTTKAPGLGSGLGLPMARGFAEQSGGAMHIESSPGKGTTVTLWLPEVEFLSDPSPGLSLLPGAQAASEIGNATVSARLLLVDDEESVREVLAEHLEYEGFGVLTAANGSEALALLVTGQAVDALVTDLSMPGMDGIELIRAAQQRRPGLPAVLLTGYAGDDAALALGGLVSGAFSLLRKPVRIHDLVDRVQALLEAAANRVH